MGATLYELVTLQPAFAGHDRQELLRQIAFEEPVRAAAIESRPSRSSLETIVAKAMEKNPADRYATAKEMADDLKRFLNDEPTLAPAADALAAGAEVGTATRGGGKGNGGGSARDGDCLGNRRRLGGN